MQDQDTATLPTAKLRYHAWRRGMKEMDLILGHFADRYLAQMVAKERQDFAKLLRRHDQALLKLLTDEAEPPIDDPDYALLMQLRKFIADGGAVKAT